jgi:hypothetical protein
MNEQQLAAVKQALEALKECRCDPRLKYEHPFYDKVITDLEQAIAQNALDKKAENARELGLDYEPAPVQEKNQSPYPEYDRGFSNGWDRGFAAAQPAPVQEPEQKPMHPELKKMYEDFFDKCFKETVDLALDTIPPAQRQWVGLTDEEVKKISKKHKWHESNVAPHLMPVFRSLEAKLKEKNHG